MSPEDERIMARPITEGYLNELTALYVVTSSLRVAELSF